ncbi:MAG: SH3 domain-containing protein [bacterium]|nr:SH3 domain-containing protein [bacterium]
MRRKFILVTLFLTVFISAFASTASAQDRITDRYNQILAHLTSYLGLSAPIQFLDSWTWEEIVGSNSGFDCPAPGVSYPSSPNRYLKYTINYDGQRYDYRVNGDGTILVLCGASGQPLARLENGVNVLTALPPAPTPTATTVAIPVAPWYVWFYMPTADRLILYNQNGEVVTVNRPRIANEVLASDNLKMAFSRDGRYLVQSVKVSPNIPTLSIYDFATGTIRSIPLAVTDTVQLGFGNDFYSPAIGSTYIFSPDSKSVAVGVARSDSPEFNEWRVMVIDLATGSITKQVRHTEIAAITVAPSVEITSALTGFGSFFPNIVYWDNLGNIHFQLIYQFAGGALTYPALAWNPTTNSATVSPYNRSSIDLLPTDGSIIYTDNEPTLPALPSEGMFPTQNVIRRGLPIGTSMTPQQLFTTPIYNMYAARWTTGGTQVAFLFEDSINPARWGIYTIGVGVEPFLQLSDGYDMLVGVSNGAVTTAEGFDTFVVTWHQNGITPTNIGTLPPMSGNPSIAWAQPFNSAFGLTSLVTSPTTGTTPPSVSATPLPLATSSVVIPVGATVLCTGAPVSIVRVGIAGRVFVGGVNRGPLNVRQTASTTAPISRIIPEGTRFDIIGGPQCGEGYTWWQIRLDDGVVAWVAEGTSAQYFIEPAP